jgi:t-SNARE complex subunit (syntaxin)
VEDIEYALNNIETAVQGVETAVEKVEKAINDKWSTAQAIVAVIVCFGIWSILGYALFNGGRFR